MVSSFQRRRLRITFRLATGTFNKEGNPDTVILEGYRAEVDIEAPAGYQFSNCRARIFGIEREVMNRLSVIGINILGFMENQMIVEASDVNGGYVKIFVGDIFFASPDYTGAPDVPFLAEARAGLVSSLAESEAISYPGARKVKDIMEVLAKEVNLTLQNNGVESTISDQYLAGTAINKIQTLAYAARIQYWYLPEEGVLAIAPQGKARESKPVIFNFENGLVGWPVKTPVGVEFTSLFNPAVFHGCKILMESDVPACNGEWYIVGMTHKLTSEIPGGAWFTYFTASQEDTFILGQR